MMTSFQGVRDSKFIEHVWIRPTKVSDHDSGLVQISPNIFSITGLLEEMSSTLTAFRPFFLGGWLDLFFEY